MASYKLYGSQRSIKKTLSLNLPVTLRLLFFIVILQLCDNAGSARSGLFTGHVSKEKDKPTDGVLHIVRVYKLLNQCSEKHVRVYGRNREKKKPVDASADDDDEWADLRVETSSFDSHLTIQSNKSRKYLCFNKRGKLKVRHSGKRDLCVFKEIHEEDNRYTEFQSVYNPMWKLGFNKRGSPLRGDFYARKDGTLRKKYLNCMRFTKREFNPYAQPGPDITIKYSPVGTEHLLKHLLNGGFPHKTRHSRSRPHRVRPSR